MSESVLFETPERVAVQYELSGLGTRFYAWVADLIAIFLLQIALFLFALVTLFAFPNLLPEIPAPGLIIAILAFVFGALPLLYFTILERVLDGQTFGKRTAKIRVVMADGVALTFTAVLIRNIFRLLDNLPLLWPVPFFNARFQRLGDIVAGTIVINEAPPELNALRAQLLARAPDSQKYTFSALQLGRLTNEDFDAIGAFLNRRASLNAEQTAAMAARLAGAFAARMECATPTEPAPQLSFLEDLLTAYLVRSTKGIR